jgi:DNA polymerase theta
MYYLKVTPYSICDQWNVDWMKVFSIWEDLPDYMRIVGEMVGVEDRFLIKAMRSSINLGSTDHVSY